MSRATGVRSHGTAGMTIAELLIALTIFSLIIGAALGFMDAQNRAFMAGLERVRTLSGARFALQALENDLETLGTNVAGGQPVLVYAGSDVVAFSADYATNVANDPFAVFYDPDAPTGQVTSPSSSIRIPTTTFDFPDTTYMSGGALSPAELLTFFFVEDTTTAVAADYVLYRQVNNAPAELVARGVARYDGEPFFEYHRPSPSGLVAIPNSTLPVRHSVPIHLSAADTGQVALGDSVRAIRIRIGGIDTRDPDPQDPVLMSRLVYLPNADGGPVEACGSAPLLGANLDATLTNLPSGDRAVDLQWGQAIDENGGEGDVVRYVIWRRPAGATTWDEPYLSIPAGAPSYSYTDTGVESGESYQYGLAAQDCTPTLSGVTASDPVIVP